MNKLLILGGGIHESYLVNRARQLGYYTIVTEYFGNSNVSSPAKAVADEAWDISWNDIDIVCKKCVEQKVDGVLTGFSEYKVDALIRITKQLGLPCYCTMDQLNITRQKQLFKATCREYGLPTVPEFVCIEDVNDSDFPVIVKPVDRGGSIGITTAYSRADLKKCIDYAMSLSDAKQVIIEKFMSNYSKFDIYYLIIDGEYYFITSSDTQMYKRSKGTETLQKVWTYPSCFESVFKEKYDNKIKAMLRGCDIKQGYITMSAFVRDGEFHFFETGYRFSGEHSFDISEMNMRVNYIDSMIAYAMGEDVSKFTPNYDSRTLYSIVLNYAGKEGKATAEKGIEKIMSLSCLKSFVQYKKAGDIIGTKDRPHPRVAMISLCSFDKQELIACAKMVCKYYDIVDANDHSLLYEKPNEANFQCMEFI